MRLVNSNTLHLTFIISVSRSSEMLYFPTCLMVENPVESIGVLLEIETSFAKLFFVAGKWTFWPSNRRRKSSHWISSGLHLWSLIRIISASSEPTHANLSHAGSQNVLNTFHKDCSRKIFLQFVGPTSKMFLNFPLSLESRVLRAAAKAFGCISFLVSNSFAEINQRPSSQPSMHICLVVSWITDILSWLSLAKSRSACFISQAISIISQTTFLLGLSTNVARSSLPCLFCSAATDNSWVRFLILFSIQNSDTSVIVRRLHVFFWGSWLFLICDCRVWIFSFLLSLTVTPFGVALHSLFGTRWTSFSQIRVALTMKHFIVMLAYIPICGVISTLILGKMNHNTKLFLQTSLRFKPSLWTTQRKWDMVVESFAIFMAFHATGPMVWLDFTSAIERHGDGIAERFSPGKFRKFGLRISNQVNAACLFRINFHSYLILFDYL